VAVDLPERFLRVVSELKTRLLKLHKTMWYLQNNF